MGSVVVRRRRGRAYAYYVYYDGDGRRVEKYCGAQDDPGSARRLLEAEEQDLEEQIKRLTTRLIEVWMKLGKPK